MIWTGAIIFLYVNMVFILFLYQHLYTKLQNKNSKVKGPDLPTFWDFLWAIKVVKYKSYLKLSPGLSLFFFLFLPQLLFNMIFREKRKWFLCSCLKTSLLWLQSWTVKSVLMLWRTPSQHMFVKWKVLLWWKRIVWNANEGRMNRGFCLKVLPRKRPGIWKGACRDQKSVLWSRTGHLTPSSL